MYLALVYFPNVDHTGFQNFRNKYEPYASLLPEHLTMVFPVPEALGQEKLELHIAEVLRLWKPFEVHFCNLYKERDHWLFWTLEEGNELCMRLHDEFYTGILGPHLREDLPYTPHIGLGLFSKEDYDFNNPLAELSLDKEKYQKARREFEQLNFDLWCTIDQLALLRINAEFTEVSELRRFSL